MIRRGRVPSAVEGNKNLSVQTASELSGPSTLTRKFSTVNVVVLQ